jgi:predicted RNase H-like HicB family nuclease
MTQKIAAKARPLSLQVTVSVPALVFAEPKAGGFSAEVPLLPGCYTQGETLEEVETNLREAIEGWLAAAHDQATIETQSTLWS